MTQMQLIQNGSTKKVFSTEKDNQVVLEFVDSETRFDGDKLAKFAKKGEIRTALSKLIFEYLESYNIPTHWESSVDENRIKVKKLDMLPIKVMIRNIAAGSLCERFQIEKGTPLQYPVLEYYLKNTGLQNPIISESHAYAFGHATPEEMKHISRLSSKVNAVLKAYMERRKLKLVDYELEFGRYQNQIYLGDEITPDNARFWSINEKGGVVPNEFRFSNSKAEESYREILKRMVCCR